MDPLGVFSPETRAWFERAFAAPTPAQPLGWPAIASRRAHADPGADRLRQDARRVPLRDRPARPRSRAQGLRLLYVSPLKALNYDIERNLRGPLAGLESQLRVAVRTGDTPQKERAAMLRHPPDILITTPESLFLLLTSRRARSCARPHADPRRGARRRRARSAARTSRSRVERLERLVGRAVPAHRALGDAAPARGDRPLRLRRRADRARRRRHRARSSTSRSSCRVEDMREPPCRAR